MLAEQVGSCSYPFVVLSPVSASPHQCQRFQGSCWYQCMCVPLQMSVALSKARTSRVVTGAPVTGAPIGTQGQPNNMSGAGHWWLTAHTYASASRSPGTCAHVCIGPRPGVWCLCLCPAVLPGSVTDRVPTKMSPRRPKVCYNVSMHN